MRTMMMEAACSSGVRCGWQQWWVVRLNTLASVIRSFIQQKLLRPFRHYLISSPIHRLLIIANAMANHHHHPTEYTAPSTATDRWYSFRKLDFETLIPQFIWLTFSTSPFSSPALSTPPNKPQLTYPRSSTIRIILVWCITKLPPSSPVFDTYSASNISVQQ